ncbi:MAG: hypothetical protein AAFU85_11695 [Planctomycetota bacterium]
MKLLLMFDQEADSTPGEAKPEFGFDATIELSVLLFLARGTAVGGLQPLSATVVTDPRTTARQIIETAESSCLGIAIEFE